MSSARSRVAADHRRAQPLRAPAGVGRDREQPERRERRCLALDRQRAIGSASTAWRTSR